MVSLCFGVNFVQVPLWVANDADQVGCSVTLAGSNFDTFRIAAAIELDGMVQGSFHLVMAGSYSTHGSCDREHMEN